MQIHVIDGGGLAADNHYDRSICQFTLLCAAEHKGRGVCDLERSLRVEASRVVLRCVPPFKRIGAASLMINQASGPGGRTVQGPLTVGGSELNEWEAHCLPRGSSREEYKTLASINDEEKLLSKQEYNNGIQTTRFFLMTSQAQTSRLMGTRVYVMVLEPTAIQE